MKKIFKYLAVMLLVIVPAISFALDFRAGEQPSTKKEERLNKNVYMVGGSITSSGTIRGDLLTGGADVIIKGDVDGDVMSGGGNVTILSNVSEDVRVGGGTVVVEGKIGGDLLVGGGQVNISGAGIGGDVAIGGGNVRIDAPIKGELIIGGGNVYINAPITGNVKIQAEKVTLGSDAVILGNISYKAKTELIKEEGAVIRGTVDFEQISKRANKKLAMAALFSGVLLWKFFTLLACSLLIGLMFNRLSKELVNIAKARPLFEIGRGLITLMLIPMISIFLLISMVGIPFGILGMFGFVMLMLFAWIIAPIILGSVIYQYFTKKEIEVSWKTILIGVVSSMVLGFIPFIGWLVQMLLMFITLGSIIALKLRIVKEWR